MMKRNIFIVLCACLLQNFALVIAEDAIPLPPQISMKQERSVNKILEKSKAQENEKHDTAEHSEASVVEGKNINIKTPKKSISKQINIAVNKDEGDMYLPLASTICIFINETNSNGCRIKQYDTSIQAAQALLNGDAELLITHSLLGKYIVDGKEPFNKNMQNKKLRFVLSLFNELLSIVARRDVEIKNLDNLKSSSINIARSNSKTRMFMDHLLELKNFNLNAFAQVTELNFDDAIDTICGGNVKAIAIVAEKFNKYLKNVTRKCDVNIVRLSQDEIDLFKNTPAYVTDTIEGGIYVGIPTDVETVAIKSILLTTSDIPNDIIYFIVETIFNRFKVIQHLNKSFSDITTAKMLNEGRITTLHDGVVDFTKNSGYKDIVQNFSSSN